MNKPTTLLSDMHRPTKFLVKISLNAITIDSCTKSSTHSCKSCTQTSMYHVYIVTWTAFPVSCYITEPICRYAA